MTTRRNNRVHRAKTVVKTIALPCEPCRDLKYTPDFAGSIMALHNLTAAQVPAWYHQRGHSIFSK